MKKTLRGFSNVKLILIGIIVVLAIGVGGYAYHKSGNSSTFLSVPTGWTLYKNSEYGFQFIYPDSWGSISTIKDTGHNDRSLNMSFSNIGGSSNKRRVVLTFYSDKVQTIVCGSSEGSCVPSEALSGQKIQTVLKGDRSHFIKYDTVSYSVLMNEPSQGGIATLSTFQIVNITKTGIHAVRAVYTKSGSVKDCPEYKLSTNNDVGCITESNYSEIKLVLKSIKKY